MHIFISFLVLVDDLSKEQQFKLKMVKLKKNQSLDINQQGVFTLFRRSCSICPGQNSQHKADCLVLFLIFMNTDMQADKITPHLFNWPSTLIRFC